MDPTDFPTIAAPTLLDPRIMVMVPKEARPAITVLWQLEARLFALAVGRREAMLAQIKLAWWRDRMYQIVNDPAALPGGEPLLAELATHWVGHSGLPSVIDGYEAAILAEDFGALERAAQSLAAAMRVLLNLEAGSTALTPWAMLRAGQMTDNPELAASIFSAVGVKRAQSIQTGQAYDKAVGAVDRWALMMAKGGGTASARAEAWLLLRAGIGF